MSARTTLRFALAAGAFALVAPAIATAAPIGWTTQFGTIADDFVDQVGTDSSGNLYLTGETGGTLGAATFGSSDVYLRKLDADGNVKWTKQFGSAGVEYPSGLATTASGDSYVGGTTEGNLAGTVAGTTDGFLAKFDRNGKQKWIKQFGGAGTDNVTGVAVAKSGNVYVSGVTEVSGDDQATLTKFDKNGNQKWQRVVGTASIDRFDDVAVSATEDIYVVGGTWGDLVGPNAGAQDAIVARYDKNGNQKWIRQTGTIDVEGAGDVAVTATGEPRVVGASDGTLPDATPSNAGDVDGFVWALDKNGATLWQRMLGTSEHEQVTDVAVSKAGTTYVIGDTDGTFPGYSTVGNDAFIATFSSSGVAAPVRQFHAEGSRFGFDGIAIRKGTGHGGPIIVAGSLEGALFGHTATGDRDVFAMALPS